MDHKCPLCESALTPIIEPFINALYKTMTETTTVARNACDQYKCQIELLEKENDKLRKQIQAMMY